MAHCTVLGHFSAIAPKYRDLTTTDLEPIIHIARWLRDSSRIRVADVGCGPGRYDLELLQLLGHKIEHFYCVDITQGMLEQVKDHRANHRAQDFEVVRSDARHLPFGKENLNCIFTFNAIHHFDVPAFLSEVARILKERGYLFIYTRFRSQNRRNIWGKHFPLFCEKETRLHEFDELERMVNAAPELSMQRAMFFRYPRVSSLGRLLELARHHHYSTFCLYSKREFRACLATFEENLRETFEGPDKVSWTDENVMLTVRKD